MLNKIKIWVGYLGCSLIRVGFPKALIILNTSWGPINSPREAVRAPTPTHFRGPQTITPMAELVQPPTLSNNTTVVNSRGISRVEFR